MIAHDPHFKQLLRTFFREFLAAFIPEVGRHIKPGAIEFLDKELLRAARGRYRSRIVDLVARVQLRHGAGFLLMHIEHQGRRETEVRKRLFFYAIWLMEQYDLPVYPILLTSYERPTNPEPDRFVLDVLGRRVVEFRFHVVQLNRLSWREFVQVRNPAVAALMANMRIAPADRVLVRLQILRMLVKLRLDPAKMHLIAGFVSAYLKLTNKEWLAFRHQVDKIEDRQVKVKAMELITEWERQGREQGRQEEGFSIVQRLLTSRFGTLPQPIRKQIKLLNLRDIEALADALLNFHSLADLKRWLAASKR